MSESLDDGASSVSRWMVVARWAWIPVGVIAVGVLIASIPGYLHPLGSDLPSGFSEEDVGALALTGLAFGRLVSFGTAALSISLAGLLYWQRADDRMALLVSYFLLIYGVTFTGPSERVEIALTGQTQISVIAATLLLTVPTVLIFSLFPNGTFVPRWTRWLSLGSIAWIPVYFAVSPANPTPSTLQTTYAVGFVWILFIIVPMLYAQIYRYRRVSTASERQQTKWVLYGFGLWLTLIVLSSVPYLRQLSQPDGAAVPVSFVGLGFIWWVTQAILPVSLGISMLRYRLWEIDLIINRTLVYGILTVVLALLYFGTVVTLQQVFRSIAGQNSPLAIVISTLIIAALFNPLRERLQAFINRRFYRGRYSAVQALNSFAETVRDEVDLERMETALLSAIEQTMHPTHLSIWVRDELAGKTTVRKAP